jgi:hypothetical protein
MSLDFKKNIVNKILEQLERDLELLKSSALAAAEAATHEESKAEDKYDTRGLEASYLAGAQARRAGEIQRLIQSYRFLELRAFGPHDPIAITALVEFEIRALDEAGVKKQNAFLVPQGGGLLVELDGQRIQIITPVSNLGEELIGRRQGDEFEYEAGAQTRQCRIVSVE